MSIVVRLRRALASPIAQKLGKKCKFVIKPALLIIGMKAVSGGINYKQELPTIIIVSHEASSTGAPILALNLCQRLSANHNIITILVRGGPLLEEFKSTSTSLIQPRLGIILQELVEKAIKLTCKGQKPAYAIVNSIVSAGTIQPLRSYGIPTLTLIHEFSAYIKPISILDTVGLWSSKIIFSSPLTKQDIISQKSSLSSADISVLPQGPCKRPNLKNEKKSTFEPIDDDATRYLKNLDENSILVLGAGEVQPRKGVDIFIAVSSLIYKAYRNRSIQFAWIGSGYEPEYDFNISLWLADQIKRLGLQDNLAILNPSPAYGDLMNRADLFLMTSRLDPLPNVSIDAMMQGKPMLCFDKACGMANLIAEDSILADALISPFFDISAMAIQAKALLDDKNYCSQIGLRSQVRAQEWFNMDSYIEKLQIQAKDAIKKEKKLEEDLEYLLNVDQFTIKHAFSPEQKLTSRKSIYKYLASWQNEIWPRKPMPGFHPGIYRDNMLSGDRASDPYAAYIKAGYPKGPWQAELITPSRSENQYSNSYPVALHIHVHYIDILEEIYTRASFNSTIPDIYITCSNKAILNEIKSLSQKHGMNVRDIITVQNRGRDIGPLLIELGSLLDREYKVHGHIHTKKSILINKSQGDMWRNFLYTNLIGNQYYQMIDKIMCEFSTNDDLGIIYPDDPTCVGWCSNIEYANDLAEQLNISDLPRSFNFPVGTMFWAKKGALSNLYDLKFNWKDFPIEPIDYDGTVLHAIERLIPLIAKNNGFKEKLTYVKGVTR